MIRLKNGRLDLHHQVASPGPRDDARRIHNHLFDTPETNIMKICVVQPKTFITVPVITFEVLVPVPKF
jgi:hypothetical protein